MWKGFNHNDNSYLIKIKFEADIHDVYLTDLQKIWKNSYKEESFLQSFNESNPLLDVKIEDVTAQVTDLVKHIDMQEIIMLETQDELKLSIKNVKPEVTIAFTFDLNKIDSKALCDVVTVPLITTIRHLEEKQNMLCNLIKKKDRELEEYQLEKGVISRADLTTEKFDDKTLCGDDNRLMLNVFGKSFWDTFVAQYGISEVKVEEIHQDPWNHRKRKRKVYSSKTAIKKGKGINYAATSST